MTVTVKPVGAAQLGDVAALFGSSRTTEGCYCMWFVLPAKECSAGWSGGNKVAFEALVESGTDPFGVLAYRNREPVGWAAVGPRSRYARALRSAVLKGRDPDEDDQVWFLPCFFIRRDARGAGVARRLLEAAVDLAQRRGATAIEAFPLAGGDRQNTGNAFVGVEPLFASTGFTAVNRPTPKRVVMRRDLTRSGT
jgi:GNAT superfamily N-acetyltransferase